MGFLASGRKVDETAEQVRYAFERYPGDPEAGVLTIPVEDPEEGWAVDARPGSGGDPGEHPKSAVVVVVKALRAFRSAGAWPDEVHYSA